MVNENTFSSNLLRWFDAHGRKDLPWQHPRSAYRVWISEIMLQQTQVKTVLPYFERFIQRFPTITELAIANEDEVLALWSGLGYYSRARNLYKTAIIIYQDFYGNFPTTTALLETLPGIGASTAAAIASLAYDKPCAILDGNVKRVLSRYFMIKGLPNQALTQKTLWQKAKECMPNTRCADYSQAIMDLGAICCTRSTPTCDVCPLQSKCLARQYDKIEEYPNRNPKKDLPTRHQLFLVLHQDNELIYLEKRPSKGIWGGLWCVPAIDINECPQQYLMQAYQIKTATPQVLMTIKHSFSHFHLHVQAISLQILPPQVENRNLSGKWFTENQFQQCGLPKPVSTILQSFIKSKINRCNAFSNQQELKAESIF